MNPVKLGQAVIFIKYLANVVSFILLSKTLVLSKITFPASKFAESCQPRPQRIFRYKRKAKKYFFSGDEVAITLNTYIFIQGKGGRGGGWEG